MRNQFGGHAVQAAGPADHARRRLAGRQVAEVVEPLVRRPPVTARLPLLPRPGGRAGAGRHVVRRAQRAGQDQHRRGDRLPLPPAARTGSPPTCRWYGEAPARRWCARPWCATSVARCSRSRSTPASPTARGSTGPAAAGARAARPGAHRACSRPTTWRWSRATRPSVAGSPTTCWCCTGARGTPAPAADYDRVLKQRNSLLKTARGAGQLGRVGALHPGGLGRAPGPAGRGDHGRAQPAGRGAEPPAGQGLRGGRPRGEPRRRDDHLQAQLPDGRGRPASTTGGGPRGRDAGGDPAPTPRRARPRRLAGRPAPRRPALLAGRVPGEGLCQPRGVVVVRAGDAAGLLRAAAQRPATTRC